MFSKNKPVILLILAGLLTWLATMVKSGINYSYGMGFWGPNGHDGIWHIALIESLSKGSWQMPMFAGEQIKNYHIGFDLLVAIIRKLSHIPVVTLYFQVLPPILALAVGISAYLFVLTWTKSKVSAFWATFFVYFGGSFGWIVTLFKNGGFGGESIFWSQQAISTLINPPFAMSLVLLFLGLTFLIRGLRENSKKYLTLATFFFGVLVQIKVYAGFLMMFGLLTVGFWQLLYRRKSFILKVFTGSLVLSILLFSDLSTSGENLVVFKPFWFLESLFASPDRLYWQKFSEALINYKLGEVWFKAILGYLLAFAVFVIGNFGSRLLSLAWFWKKGMRIFNYRLMDLMLLVIIASGVVVPMFFVQSGNPWNTIQFLYYSLVFSGIITGIWLGEFMEKTKLNIALKYGFLILIVFITIPTTIGTLFNDYLPMRPPAMISNEELKALAFLKDQPDGVVLTLPYNPELANKAVNNPPRPLYLYESTAYVSAMTGKKIYLEDEINLEITDYDWRSRRKQTENYLENSNSDFLSQNNISYVYVVKKYGVNFDNTHLKNIYSNSEVNVYRVN